MALTLSQLVNDYGSYSGTTLRGIYGASAQVPNRGFGDVQGVPYDNITFIIKVNGKKYASSKWLSEQQNGNPYLSSNTVARIDAVDIPLAPISSVPFLDKDGERYAEVKASSNLTSDNSILNFINQLLANNDEIKPASSWGSWSGNVQRKVTVPTTIQDPLGNPYQIGVVGSKYGNTYNADIDLGGTYPGLEFEETGFDGKVGGAEALATTVSVKDEEVKETPVDSGTNVGDISSDFQFEPIDLTDFKIEPFDIDLGLRDLNLDFGFGLGGDIPINNSNTNPLTDYDIQEAMRPQEFGKFGF